MDRKGPVRGRMAWAARRPRVAAVAGCALLLSGLLSGCGLLGSGVTVVAPAAMSVTSETFTRNVMPSRYTCAGPRVVSPPVSWAGEPAGTKSVALVFDDSDAPITPYVYWIIFDIRPTTSTLLEGTLPPGARVARNSAGRASYDPPCPGPHAHGYRFTVYALKATLNLPDGTSLVSAWQAIAAATIGRGRLPVSASS